jgi:hypothetical protein
LFPTTAVQAALLVLVASLQALTVTWHLPSAMLAAPLVQTPSFQFPPLQVRSVCTAHVGANSSMSAGVVAALSAHICEATDLPERPTLSCAEERTSLLYLLIHLLIQLAVK